MQTPKPLEAVLADCIRNQIPFSMSYNPQVDAQPQFKTGSEAKLLFKPSAALRDVTKFPETSNIDDRRLAGRCNLCGDKEPGFLTTFCLPMYYHRPIENKWRTSIRTRDMNLCTSCAAYLAETILEITHPHLCPSATQNPSFDSALGQVLNDTQGFCGPSGCDPGPPGPPGPHGTISVCDAKALADLQEKYEQACATSRRYQDKCAVLETKLHTSNKQRDEAYDAYQAALNQPKTTSNSTPDELDFLEELLQLLSHYGVQTHTNAAERRDITDVINELSIAWFTQISALFTIARKATREGNQS